MVSGHLTAFLHREPSYLHALIQYSHMSYGRISAEKARVLDCSPGLQALWEHLTPLEPVAPTEDFVKILELLVPPDAYINLLAQAGDGIKSPIRTQPFEIVGIDGGVEVNGQQYSRHGQGGSWFGVSWQSGK